MNDETDINVLAAHLERARAIEIQAKYQREEFERQILEHSQVKPHAKATGTVNTGPFKVVYKETNKWDQDHVSRLSEEIRSDGKADYFPFKQEWKPDNAALKVFKERFPGLHKSVMTACTTKPAKPSISIITTEEKE